MFKFFLRFLFGRKIAFFLIFLSFQLYPQSFLERIQLYPSLVNILQKPEFFFGGFQYEMDNINPIYGKKYLPVEWRNIAQRKLDDVYENPISYRFSITLHPQALLYSLISYSLKATAVREDAYIPQIYFGFGHYFYVPLYVSLLDGPYKDIMNDTQMHSFSASIGFAKSMKKNFKLFGGYRFAYGFLNMTIPNNLPTTIEEFFGDSIKKDWFLHDIFVGFTFLLPNSDWEALMSVGFNPQLIHFGTKLEFLYKYVGIGLGYYPNNIIFPFRPFVRLQFEF